MFLLENRGAIGEGDIGRVEIAVYGDREFVFEPLDGSGLRTGAMSEADLQGLLQLSDSAGLLRSDAVLSDPTEGSCEDDFLEMFSIAAQGMMFENDVSVCLMTPAFSADLQELRETLTRMESVAFVPDEWVIVDGQGCRVSDTEGDEFRSHPVFPHETGLPLADIVPRC